MVQVLCLPDASRAGLVVLGPVDLHSAASASGMYLLLSCFTLAKGMWHVGSVGWLQPVRIGQARCGILKHSIFDPCCNFVGAFGNRIWSREGAARLSYYGVAGSRVFREVPCSEAINEILDARLYPTVPTYTQLHW